jgi:hypothetical protein
MPIIMLIVSMLFILSIGVTIFFWIKRRRYTRERFAFAALTSICIMVLLGIGTVPAGETPWNILFIIIAKLIGYENYIPKSPGFIDYAFIFLVIYLAIQSINKLHKNWGRCDGAISTQQYIHDKRHEQSPLLLEGISELTRIIKKEQALEVYDDLADKSEILYAIDCPTNSLSWHTQAKELFVLKSSRYTFPDDQWHEQYSCWFGTNKMTNNPVIIFCSTIFPDDKKITDFFDYIKKYSENNGIDFSIIEIFFSIKENCSRSDITYENYTYNVETESSLLNNLVDFEDYFSDIKYKVEMELLPDSKLTLQETYVPSFIKEISDNDDSKPIEVESYLRNWLEESGQRQLSLLGEYGQGKSTCALLFSYNLINDLNNKTNFIPVLMELRGKSPRNMTPEEMLASWALRYNINPNALMKLLISGRILLILEGFDEMALIGDSEMRLNHFRSLWQFCYPKAKILITGRPNFFLDNNEMKAALGLREAVTGKPYCHALHLKPFILSQIHQSLRNIPNNVKNEIFALANDDSKFYKIVARPSLLFIVSLIWERENLSQYKGSMNSAFIISLFIRNSYRRQGIKIEDGINFMALNSNEREFFMSGVAAFMASNYLPNQISKEKFHDAVTSLLKVIPESVSFTDAISGEVGRVLRERIKDDEHAIEHIKTDVRACGILVFDPIKSGALKFAHKSFMEYLFAAVVANNIIQNEQEEITIQSSGAIISAFDTDLSCIFSYKESVMFLVELLVSSLKVENADITSDNKSLATSLFKQIVHSHSNNSVRKRINSFSIDYLLLLMKFGLLRDDKIVRSTKLMIYSQVVMVSALTSIVMIRKQTDFLSPIFSVVLSTILMIPAMFVTTGQLKAVFGKTYTKIKLWYLCCSSLGISEDILSKIIGEKAVLNIQNSIGFDDENAQQII